MGQSQQPTAEQAIYQVNKQHLCTFGEGSQWELSKQQHQRRVAEQKQQVQSSNQVCSSSLQGAQQFQQENMPQSQQEVSHEQDFAKNQSGPENLAPFDKLEVPDEPYHHSSEQFIQKDPQTRQEKDKQISKEQPTISECRQSGCNNSPTEPELNQGSQPKEASPARPIDKPSQSLSTTNQAQVYRRDRSRVYGCIQSNQIRQPTNNDSQRIPNRSSLPINQNEIISLSVQAMPNLRMMRDDIEGIVIPRQQRSYSSLNDRAQGGLVEAPLLYNEAPQFNMQGILIRKKENLVRQTIKKPQKPALRPRGGKRVIEVRNKDNQQIKIEIQLDQQSKGLEKNINLLNFYNKNLKHRGALGKIEEEGGERKSVSLYNIAYTEDGFNQQSSKEEHVELLTKEERILREQEKFKALFHADLFCNIKPVIENFGHGVKSNLKCKAEKMQAKKKFELEKEKLKKWTVGKSLKNKQVKALEPEVSLQKKPQSPNSSSQENEEAEPAQQPSVQNKQDDVIRQESKSIDGKE